jgi:hypothetical protein
VRLGLLLALAMVQLVLGAVQQWEQMQEQMQGLPGRVKH